MSSASLGQSAEAKVSPMETSSYTREAPSGEGSDRKVQAKGIARDSERQPVEITTTQRRYFAAIGNKNMAVADSLESFPAMPYNSPRICRRCRIATRIPVRRDRRSGDTIGFP